MNLTFLPEIEAARERGQPVVALESTLITHGLPWPLNLEAASRLETIVRDAGSIPATIAILHGTIRIGLRPDELEQVARRGDARKCSLRDLPGVLARREWGSTTVAATTRLAFMAGIRVFATGGIGGVHRGNPMDVSADLRELGHSPVTVVCAGAKAILDLPATLEVLETEGVCVVGYRTDEFPAFYTRSSGLPLTLRCDSVAEIAEVVRSRDRLGLSAAVLVTNPVPVEDELPAAQAETAIAQALAEAETAGCRGNAITPFLLARVSELTGTASRKANLSLLRNNARLASEIAAELASHAS